MSATIGFYGGTGEVTGANFLLDTGASKILVDCGLIQGGRFSLDENCNAFPYKPTYIDALFVTHAHADHIGRIPKLVAEGFKGTIYSTEATRDLARVMLDDAYGIMEYEAKQQGTEPCFQRGDIDAAMKLWKTASYKKPLTLTDGVTATLQDAGHILGSAFIIFERGGKKIVFTGDIGNVPQPLLPPPDVPKDYDYMVMESVYGDRQHEEVATRSKLLKSYIEDTISKNGTLIIPAFSLERTQAMLFEINNFIERKEIPAIPVFLDSPLAIRVTELYRQHTGFLKAEVQEQIKKGDDIFDFPKLSFTEFVKDSRAIERVKGAKIIIAGSGMSHGGRILRHEQQYLGNKNTTLLLVGYQAVGGIGRLLLDGAKRVKIDGMEVKVRAKVARIQGYSGHADRDQLVDFVAHGGDKAKQIFVTMGEERASLFLVQRLRDYLGVNAITPELGQVVEIDL